MNGVNDPQTQPAILPELEQSLLRAARHRAAPRLGRRRWILATAAATLVLAGGAAAATGILHLASGRTSQGPFSVETRPAPAGAQGSICLQLHYDGRGPSYGCGDPPTAAKPFGLLVYDRLDEGSREGVIYGLTANEIVRVGVLGSSGRHTDVPTEAKEGLPGRFFALVVPTLSRVEVVGYDVSGRAQARIGNLDRSAQRPLSKAGATARGNPAGFAPTAPSPRTYIYRGKSISEAEANRLGLACLQGREAFTCHRSSVEAETGP